MKSEFMAQYPFALKDGVAQAFAIDFLVHKQSTPPTRWTEPAEIDDDWMRLMILSQAIASPYKEQARVGLRRDPGGYAYWLKNGASAFLKMRLNEMRALELVTSNISSPQIIFPPGSWTLQFSFTLRKPYISRDDTDFYIIDNPVKKEWVFKVPYIAPSQWKGALRSAMMQDLVADLNAGKIDKDKFIEERLRLCRLFGNEKDGTSDFLKRSLARHLLGAVPESERGREDWTKSLEAKSKEIEEEFENALRDNDYRRGDIDGFQGSLHFYPTYFDRIGLEVINPHDRETGAGKNPIYFECVPAGTSGTFTLLYVPLVGPEVSEKEAKKDLEAVARGIKAMMTRYGFGAKTSSGFGVAKDESDWDPLIIAKDLLRRQMHGRESGGIGRRTEDGGDGNSRGGE